MNEEKKTIDFLKVIEGMNKTKMEELKEAYKAMRDLYLGLREAGFTMEEGMTFIAAMCKPNIDPNGGGECAKNKN